MNKNKIIFGLILALAAAVLLLIIRGDEDTWLCQNGQWVKHGNPSAAMPSKVCPGGVKIKVFFNNDKLDPEFSCNKVFSTERNVVKTLAAARAALEELLAGPKPDEQVAGYFTNINPGVKIQKLVIKDGAARVDFDEQLQFQVGGSCRVSAIRAQITETLKQFPSVKEVIISIDGRTEDVLQP